ncbi:MAG: hemerythrin domain-containing protein [Deltaproteobacteria bacterium]|nr:hemerythrin domain-containing protein [Deltaproteobacteria bacterium]
MDVEEVLKHEHQVINLMLDGIRRELTELREVGTFDFAKLEKVLDFGRNFLDRCHHAKEEKYLFTRLEEKGQPEDHGLLAELLAEHRQGREHLAAISEAVPGAKGGDQKALQAAAGHVRAYLELLTDHIDKENEQLIPMTERLLSQAEQENVVQAFEEFETREIGPDVHEKYHALAHELAGR